MAAPSSFNVDSLGTSAVGKVKRKGDSPGQVNAPPVAIASISAVEGVGATTSVSIAASASASASGVSTLARFASG